MNYNEALKYIHESHKFGMRLGLDNIKKLLELFIMQDRMKKQNVSINWIFIRDSLRK